MERMWSRADDRDVIALLRAVAQEDLTGALLAIEGAPEEVGHEVRARMADWGQRAAAALTGDDPLSAVGALTGVLVSELGFSGAGEAYHDPGNSYLSNVLDRRHGLPILLTSVWRQVGQEAGIPVEGVGLPFHFIARVGGEEGVFIDPFKGGKILSQEDCAALVHKFSDGAMRWEDRFLSVCTVADIVERVLRNLMSAFSTEGDILGLYRAVQLSAALRPELAHYQLAQGRMAEFLGETHTATRIYTGLLRTFDGTQEAVLASERLVAMTADAAPN